MTQVFLLILAVASIGKPTPSGFVVPETSAGVFALSKANGVAIRLVDPDTQREEIVYYDLHGRMSARKRLPRGRTIIGLGTHDNRVISLTTSEAARIAKLAGAGTDPWRPTEFFAAGTSVLVSTWAGRLSMVRKGIVTWSIPFHPFDVFALDPKGRHVITITTPNKEPYASYIAKHQLVPSQKRSEKVLPVIIKDEANASLVATGSRTSAVAIGTEDVLCFLTIPSTPATQHAHHLVVGPFTVYEKDVITYGLYKVNVRTGRATLITAVGEYLVHSMYTEGLITPRSDLAVDPQGANAYYLAGMFKPHLFTLRLGPMTPRD